MAYQIKKIAGVQCVFVKIPIANNIFVQAFVKVGSACEDPHNSGISHFLEHILCQGSAKWNSQSEFDDFRVDNGIVSNGRTSLRMTHYYFEHHRDKHTLGLELLGDFISNPAMREDAIEREKGVIYHELQRSRSNNKEKFFYLMIESLYK